MAVTEDRDSTLFANPPVKRWAKSLKQIDIGTGEAPPRPVPKTPKT